MKGRVKKPMKKCDCNDLECIQKGDGICQATIYKCKKHGEYSTDCYVCSPETKNGKPTNLSTVKCRMCVKSELESQQFWDTPESIHERKITLRGSDKWIKRTLENSLPDGVNAKFLKKGDSITVETLTGDPIQHGIPAHKPEKRFETKKPVMVHLLCFDDGFTNRIQGASLDGKKIGGMVDELNDGEEGGGDPFWSFIVELQDVELLTER